MAAPTIALTPYARTMNIRVDHWRGDVPVVAIDYGEDARGNPGMLHGGALAGLLETAVHATLEAQRTDPATPLLKPMNSTVQYLRAAGEGRTFAMAEMVKAGRRLGNIRVTAWQEDPAKPVAVGIAIVAAG